MTAGLVMNISHSQSMCQTFHFRLHFICIKVYIFVKKILDSLNSMIFARVGAPQSLTWRQIF